MSWTPAGGPPGSQPPPPLRMLPRGRGSGTPPPLRLPPARDAPCRLRRSPVDPYSVANTGAARKRAQEFQAPPSFSHIARPKPSPPPHPPPPLRRLSHPTQTYLFLILPSDFRPGLPGRAVPVRDAQRDRLPLRRVPVRLRGRIRENRAPAHDAAPRGSAAPGGPSGARPPADRSPPRAGGCSRRLPPRRPGRSRLRA